MWRKSSYCDSSACVEIAYTISSHCGGGECVQVGTCTRHGVHVRDSKDPGPVLTFSPDSWRALLAGIRAGEFSIP